MKEFELKYGCNPNQKPAKIYMKDGSELPVTVLNVVPATSISSMPSTPAACQGTQGGHRLVLRRLLQARLPGGRRCRPAAFRDR